MSLGIPSTGDFRFPFVSCSFNVSQFSSTSLASAAATSPKTWGVATHQLVAYSGHHVVDGKGSSFAGHLGMEHRLHQNVAHLLCDLGGVASVNGLQSLVALLQQVPLQRFVGLLPVPGTAAGRPELGHYVHQAVERGGRVFHVHLQSGGLLWEIIDSRFG